MGQVAEALPLATPDIDYLARDFSGFRRLLLQRLSHLMPDWHETHPADLSHTLVEILAYAADQLSYYQDAVATEAYLGTARRRVSVQRHARLLDYTLHEGCNARVWVHIQVNAEVELPAGTKILTRLGGLAAPVLSTAQYLQAPGCHGVRDHAADAAAAGAQHAAYLHLGSARGCAAPGGHANHAARPFSGPQARSGAGV